MFFFGARGKKAGAKRAAAKPAPKPDFCAGAVSDVGCLRANNEDNYILLTHMNTGSDDHSEAEASFAMDAGKRYFAGVFDGMGGGEAGEVASRNAARIFLEAVEKLPADASDEAVDLLIRGAFLEANNAVLALQQQCNAFGTTATVLCVSKTNYKLYHLGDSRAYLLREGKLEQLTRDQTLAQMKLEVGMYRPDDPAVEVDKHKLTEYVGRDRTGKHLRPVESRRLPVQEGDCFLLCSDGLYDMCGDEQIAGILGQDTAPREKAAALTRLANEAGGEDNTTCLVVSLFPHEPTNETK